MLTSLLHNVAPKSTRLETLEGREYLVVPMVMMTEGVHAGNNGPVYYPETELAKTPDIWNYKPVVVYHPVINNEGVSACTPTVIEKQKIGLIMNTVWDSKAKKLRAEAWIDTAKANLVDGRVMKAIENNQMMEVSTGVFVDCVQGSSGVWNNEAYDMTATNYRADHLAVLPDRQGACSIKDGAGLLQLNEQFNGQLSPGTVARLNQIVYNELSFSAIRQRLARALEDKFGPSVWIDNVFDSTVVFNMFDVLYRVSYSSKKDTIEVTGAPERIERVVEYRTIDGKSLGLTLNAVPLPTSNEKELQSMDRKAKTTALISNAATPWTEADRAFLEGLPDENFNKIVASATAPVTNNNVGATASVATPASVATDAASYIASAPPGVREMLQNGMQQYQTQHAQAVQVVANSKTNVMPVQELQQLPLHVLHQMARFAQNEAALQAQVAAQVPAGGVLQQNGAGLTTNATFVGAAGAPANTLATNEAPLPLPSWDSVKI